MDDEQIKIDLEDIQDLVISKKFISINSNKYTESAFNYIKNLVDKERAILFDADTNRIYTLGKYYGGDELKENLLYFSKLLSIDIDNNILSELSVSENSDTLAIKGKGPLNVNLYKDQYNVLELEVNLQNAINDNPFKISDKNEYNFYIDENGKIALKEYIYPKITIKPIELNNNNNDEILTLEYDIQSSIDINNWPIFNIHTYNCEIQEDDRENRKLKVYFSNNISGDIIFEYSDGKNSDTYVYTQHWINFCIYGTCYSSIYNETGRMNIIGNNINNIIINQNNDEYGYIILPKFIKPIFIDNLFNIQGSWHQVFNSDIINNDLYNLYITDNSGLGKIEWRIINKNI